MLQRPPSNFIQRLFGQGVPANVFQLTTRVAGATTRLLISDEDHTYPSTRADEDSFADYMQVNTCLALAAGHIK